MPYAGNVEGDEQSRHLAEGGEQSHFFERFAPCNGKNKYKGKKRFLVGGVRTQWGRSSLRTQAWRVFLA